MVKYNLYVHKIEEFYLASRLLGQNAGRGRLLNVRLRSAFDPYKLLEYDVVVSTLIHELVHNWHTKHDHDFNRVLRVFKREHGASRFTPGSYYSPNKRQSMTPHPVQVPSPRIRSYTMYNSDGNSRSTSPSPPPGGLHSYHYDTGSRGSPTSTAYDYGGNGFGRCGRNDVSNFSSSDYYHHNSCGYNNDNTDGDNHNITNGGGSSDSDSELGNNDHSYNHDHRRSCSGDSNNNLSSSGIGYYTLSHPFVPEMMFLRSGTLPTSPLCAYSSHLMQTAVAMEDMEELFKSGYCTSNDSARPPSSAQAADYSYNSGDYHYNNGNDGSSSSSE
ncbi:hypothetical protein EV182_003227, partial [Spiromyces aspiralis]